MDANWWRRLKAAKPRESAVESSFCEGLPFPCVKLGGGGGRGKTDRLVLCPGGRAIFVEFKRPGEKLRKLQAAWKTWLEGLGFEHHTIDNAMDAEKLKSRIVAMLPRRKGK